MLSYGFIRVERVVGICNMGSVATCQNLYGAALHVDANAWVICFICFIEGRSLVIDTHHWCTTRYRWTLPTSDVLYYVIVLDNACRLLGRYGATDHCDTAYSACVCATYVE